MFNRGRMRTRKSRIPTISWTSCSLFSACIEKPVLIAMEIAVMRMTSIPQLRTLDFDLSKVVWKSLNLKVKCCIVPHSVVQRKT